MIHAKPLAQGRQIELAIVVALHVVAVGAQPVVVLDQRADGVHAFHALDIGAVTGKWIQSLKALCHNASRW